MTYYVTLSVIGSLVGLTIAGVIGALIVTLFGGMIADMEDTNATALRYQSMGDC